MEIGRNVRSTGRPILRNLVGLLFFLRIGEMEHSARGNIKLGTYIEGYRTITVEIANGETGQYNEGESKVRKETHHPLRPVRMFARFPELEGGVLTIS